MEHLSYATALRLKEAGFPQNPDNPTVHTPKCGGWDNPDPECREESRPRDIELEELIESVRRPEIGGYPKFTLEHDRELGWQATLWSLYDCPHAEGSNPSEAVAALILSLVEHGLLTLTK